MKILKILLLTKIITTTLVTYDTNTGEITKIDSKDLETEDYSTKETCLTITYKDEANIQKKYYSKNIVEKVITDIFEKGLDKIENIDLKIKNVKINILSTDSPDTKKLKLDEVFNTENQRPDNHESFHEGDDIQNISGSSSTNSMIKILV